MRKLRKAEDMVGFSGKSILNGISNLHSEKERKERYGNTVNVTEYRWRFINPDSPTKKFSIIKYLTDPFRVGTYTMEDADTVAIIFNQYIDELISVVYEKEKVPLKDFENIKVPESEKLPITDFREQFALTDVMAFGLDYYDIVERARLADYFAGKIVDVTHYLWDYVIDWSRY